jgi:MFS transporter, PPP family, 3-phenylpropionic acid transporter
MGARPDLLLRFLLLYAALYCSFGLSSPFLPEFLAIRGVEPQWLGLLLGAGTAVRLISAPLAGRLADIYGIFRLELGLFAISAAVASLLYLPTHSFWLLVAVNLAQAALLAPLAPLSDALALSWSSFARQAQPQTFEYGWVRGAGSAAFVTGALGAGQIASAWGLPSLLVLSAVGLFATALSTRFAPDLQREHLQTGRTPELVEQDWGTLLRQPAFVRMALAAALVLGSHAMHDAFAIIRWNDAGISPAVSSVLWSESVAAEVLVFVLLGPWLLDVLGTTAALALGAIAAAVRWGVLAQTVHVAALATIEPLHGLSFALFHLACMRIIAKTIPRGLAGTAQAFYGTVAIGGTTALLTMASGWLFSRSGAYGFWGMASLCCAALPIIWSLRSLLRNTTE